MPDPTPARPRYEFAERDEADFAHLARYIRVAATFLLVFGALSAVGGVLALAGAAGGGRLFLAVQGLAAGAVNVTIGAFLLQAAGGFRMIVDTSGRDVRHLMGAVRQLATAFLVMAVGFCVQLILVGVGLAVR